jgi:signal transduction histidine kinase
MTAQEFSAQCEPEGRRGWRASIAELDCEAHAAKLNQLRDEIAHSIHESTGLELCDIVVRLEGIFPEALKRYRVAHDQIAQATKVRDDAAREIRQVVASLRQENLTMRDIGALLGITPQRVAQLVHSDMPGDSVTTP